MRRGRAFWLLAVGGVAVAAGRDARAAELTVDAPPACVDPATLAQEVGDLVGRPLADLHDVEFRVRIGELSPGRWRLHLETIDGKGAAGAPAARGSREIDGTSCAELAEAASVAIAVSARSLEAGGEPPRGPSVKAARPDADPPPGPPATAPSATVAASAPPRPAWRPTVTLALATETGALPSTSPGVEAEGALQRGAARLVLLGTWYTSQDAVGTGASGGAVGTFQLALGGGLACYAPRRGRWTALACAGGELGRLAGTGHVARPETGAVLWRAVRAEAGTTVSTGANTAILLRAGVALPLARPEFVLDQSMLVYRPSPVSIRFTAGFELGF